MTVLRRLLPALMVAFLLTPLALGFSVQTAAAAPPTIGGTTVDIPQPTAPSPNPAQWSCPYVIVCYEIWPSYTNANGETCTCWSWLNVLTGATWENTICEDS